MLGAGFLIVGLLSAPMRVWAQSLRMRRIPAALHGRTFAVLRTLMQGTLPLGSVLAAPRMTLIAGVPGMLLWLVPWALVEPRYGRVDSGSVRSI